MRSLSRTTAILLLIMLSLSLTAAQILYCLHNTFMSSAHLSSFLEEDGKLDEVTGILYHSLSIPSGADTKQDKLKVYAVEVLAGTEEAWVKSQVYILSKALHQYIFEDAVNLPTLDIIPLKKSIKAVIVSDIMQSDEGKQKTAKVKSILSLLNNKYFAKFIDLGLNSQLVSMLLELSPVKATGFDRAAVQEIVGIYLSFSNKDISLEQASCSISEQLTADMLNLNKTKDYLDLNLFMDKAFSPHNPLKTLKAFISSVDGTMTVGVKVFLCSMLLLLCLLRRFKAAQLIKDTALCIAASGIISLFCAALMIKGPLAEGIMLRICDSSHTLSYISIKYTELLLKDSGLYLALQAALTLLPCAAVVFLASRVNKKSKLKKASRSFPTIKAAIVILGFTLIFSVGSVISIMNQYNIFRENLAKLSDTELSQSITKGLAEAGGMEFLNLLQDK